MDIDADTLTEALKALKPIYKGTSTMDVVNHVLLEPTEAGVKLTASQIDVSASWHLRDVELEKAVLVKGVKLYDLCRRLDGQLEVTTTDAGWLTVATDDTSARVPGMDTSMFPDTYDVDGVSFNVPAETLHRAKGHTAWAIGSDELRPNLCGVHLYDHDGRMLVRATNGHMLAQAPMEDAPDGWPESVIVDADAWGMSSSLEDIVEIESDGDLIQMSDGVYTITARTLEGVFPVFEDTFPDVNSASGSYLEADTLQDAVEIVGLFADDKTHRLQVDITPDDGTSDFRLYAHTAENGEGDRTVNGEGELDARTVYLNWGYLQDVLRAIDSDEVMFHPMRANGRALPTLTSPEYEGFYAIIMPMGAGS